MPLSSISLTKSVTTTKFPALEYPSMRTL
uniref:Uncharacterized protein n=1 Tax=Rhizophora mucronata TaxID=61149 RepID=A0A2P2PFV1_RHIMU